MYCNLQAAQWLASRSRLLFGQIALKHFSLANQRLTVSFRSKYSDIAIRFSDSNFKKGAIIWRSDEGFHAVTLTFDI